MYIQRNPESYTLCIIWRKPQVPTPSQIILLLSIHLKHRAAQHNPLSRMQQTVVKLNNLTRKTSSPLHSPAIKD